MQFDIENVIQDNLRLKKALQMSRFSIDKLQKQLKQLKSLNQQSNDRNKNLKDDYCQLQRKYQQSFTDSVKDNNSLISQIQQLKKIIQQKQREFQQVQIKLIPNLDQDMLRVKLITQMQGPYQQTVDKKDNEIQKLKQKISSLQRKLQISQLSQKSKITQLKKQRDQIKNRYQDENHRLMQELNMSLSRNQVQSIQASIIKNLKRDIQEYKTRLQFIQKNQQNLINQNKQLKRQRTILLQKLMLLNGKQALLLQSKSDKTQLQRLRQDSQKYESQLNRLKLQNEKHQRIKNKLQSQKVKLQNQYQKDQHNERNKYQIQKNQLKNQIYQLKQQIKRIKDGNIDSITSRDKYYQQNQMLQQQLNIKNKQIYQLKLQYSRYPQNSQANCSDPFAKKTKIDKQNNHTVQNIKTIIKQSSQNQKQSQMIRQANDLKKQNKRLKQKLGQANSKILQLIREKMSKHHEMSPQRQRSHSNIQPLGVFMQYQDCSFKPLVEPTLYTLAQKTRK